MIGRIRILHLFNEYLNTTENWAFRLIDNLPDMDVVIASREFRKCNFYSDKFDYLDFPLKKIAQNPRLFSVRLFNALVHQVSKLFPWYVAKTAGKVDLMHSHFSFVAWEYGELARKLNVPHVVSFYGFDYENLPHTVPVWRERYQTMFRDADLFLCEGRHGAKVLEKMGCPTGKIQIARIGVDAAKIPLSVRNKKPGELRLLQVATFVEKKGQRYTIQAFMKAIKDCPNMSLTLVGGDPIGIRDTIRQMLQGSEAEDKVTFIDRIEYDRLSEFMRDFHVFIHPSCYSREMDCEGGAPIVLLDAQATGMPVISTTHCDIPDEVVDGKTGLLTPEKDDMALAQSIRRFYLMADEEYREFAKAARRHVEENYDAGRNAAKVAAIYRKLAGSFKK
jgi:colanic acid/amylovoran biosynthesis glycosyltransferase